MFSLVYFVVFLLGIYFRCSRFLIFYFVFGFVLFVVVDVIDLIVFVERYGFYVVCEGFI